MSKELYALAAADRLANTVHAALLTNDPFARDSLHRDVKLYDDLRDSRWPLEACPGYESLTEAVKSLSRSSTEGAQDAS